MFVSESAIHFIPLQLQVVQNPCAMRFIQLVFSILFLSACASSQQQEVALEAASEAEGMTESVETEAMTDPSKSLDDLQREHEFNTSHPPALYQLEGTLGDETPITISLSFFKGYCFGHLTYTNVGTPIRLVGTHSDYSNYSLFEFADDNNAATGIVRLQAEGRDGDLQITGTWLNPNTDASYPLNLKRSAGDRIPAPRPHRPGDGVYSVEMSDMGPSGVLELSRKFDKIHLSAQVFSPVSAEGIPNVGDIAVDLYQEGEAWVLRAEGDTQMNCHKKLYFVDNYVFVESISSNCGFGLGAGFTQFYLREMIDPAFMMD